MAQMVEHLPGNLSSIPDNHQKQKKRRSKSRNDRYQNRDAIPSGMGDTLEGDTYTLWEKQEKYDFLLFFVNGVWSLGNKSI